MLELSLALINISEAFEIKFATDPAPKKLAIFTIRPSAE